MRTIPGVLAGTTLALVLTGCGSTGPETAEPTEGDNTGGSASTSQSPSGDKDQQITPGGIALVVLDHLGQDTVRQFVTYEPEPGSVSVMVRLRDRTPHNFAVQVYSPENTGEFGKAGSCPPQQREMGKSQCRVLDNGTTVMTSQIPHGFSDNNPNGSLLMGTVITPEAGTAGAMYESYDDSPAISVAELEDLLTDPRLSWLTDPEVNKAGQDVPVKELTG
jgi:hypothetical protein